MGSSSSKEEVDGEAMGIVHAPSNGIPSVSMRKNNEMITESVVYEKTNSMEVEVMEKDNSAIVPMVFKWEHGGRNVGISGTFNQWSKAIPMHRSGNDFTYIVNLPKGKHAYKYIVDEEWRFAPDQPTISDADGNIKNFVDVSEFVPLGDFSANVVVMEDEASTSSISKQMQMQKKANRGDELEGMYGKFMPDIDDYTKEPPPLPPHLRHIILNKVPPTVDSRLLPVPQHVALNHLYCTAIKDGMMVLGVTQRYKQKFVTTVYYSLTLHRRDNTSFTN